MPDRSGGPAHIRAWAGRPASGKTRVTAPLAIACEHPAVTQGKAATQCAVERTLAHLTRGESTGNRQRPRLGEPLPASGPVFQQAREELEEAREVAYHQEGELDAQRQQLDALLSRLARAGERPDSGR